MGVKYLTTIFITFGYLRNKAKIIRGYQNNSV